MISMIKSSNLAKTLTQKLISSLKRSSSRPQYMSQVTYECITGYKHFNAIPIIIIIWQLQMQKDGTVLKAQSKHQKKIYNLIPYQNRKALVDLVVTEGLSVYRASKVLGIKNTTAKAILRRFRRQGTIFKRKHQMESEAWQAVKVESEQDGEFKQDIKIEEKAGSEEESYHCGVIKEEESVCGEQKTGIVPWRSCGFYICYF